MQEDKREELGAKKQLLIDQTNRLISTLSPQEQIIVRAVMASKPRHLKFPEDPLGALLEAKSRRHLDSYYRAQIQLAAKRLNLPYEFVATYHHVALSKMRYTGDPETRLPDSFYAEIYEDLEKTYKIGDISAGGPPELLLPPPIESIRKLTPDLIARLKKESRDFNEIDPYVFEHLVAELLAGQGFSDVRLVGRNQQTSADIFAVKVVQEIGDEIRYYVEVKRHKNRLGVNIIDSVYGAMESEKEKFGWRGSIIVTSYEFSDLKKYTRKDLFNRGILLKDRKDLFEWLDGYKPNRHGLWVPPECCSLSDL